MNGEIRPVRIVLGGLPLGPSLIELATGEDLGRRCPVGYVPAQLRAQPGESLAIKLFARGLNGKWPFFDRDRRQIALEAVTLLVEEVLRPTSPAPAKEG